MRTDTQLLWAIERMQYQQASGDILPPLVACCPLARPTSKTGSDMCCALAS